MPESVSVEKKDSVVNWIRKHMCYTLVELLFTFCVCPKSLQETDIKCGGLTDIAEESSVQCSIQAVAWVMLADFIQNNTDDREQKTEQKNSKNLNFDQKRYKEKKISKVGVKGNMVAKEISSIKKKQSFVCRYKKKDV